MRVLVEEGHFVNKGAEAMLRTVQSEISQRFPDASFYIERGSVVPGTEELVKSAGFKIIDRKFPRKLERTNKLLRYMLQEPSEAMPLWQRRKSIYAWETILEEIDVVLDISGYRYSDTWGERGARRIAPLVELAQRNNKPYIFLPQAWGPFASNTFLRDICRKNCMNSALFFARDVESRQHLAKLLNKPLDQINQAPDIAFLFRHAGERSGQSHLANLGIRLGEQPIVCVAPNMRVYDRTVGFGAENAYLKLLINICHHFVKERVAIVLIPHEIHLNPSKVDDRWLCELIRLALGSGEKIAAVTKATPAEEIKAMISCCDLLIGSRFHAIVAALQSRVPAVSIGWAHKYEELMRDVDLDQFALNYNDLDAPKISELVSIAWKERESSKHKLSEKLPLIETAAGDVFARIAEVIG